MPERCPHYAKLERQAAGSSRLGTTATSSPLAGSVLSLLKQQQPLEKIHKKRAWMESQASSYSLSSEQSKLQSQSCVMLLPKSDNIMGCADVKVF